MWWVGGMWPGWELGSGSKGLEDGHCPLAQRLHWPKGYTGPKATLAQRLRWPKGYTGPKATLAQRLHWPKGYTGPLHSCGWCAVPRVRRNG